MRRKEKALLWTVVLIAVVFVMALSFACETGLIEHCCSGDDCLFCLISSAAADLFKVFCAVAVCAAVVRNRTVKCRRKSFFKTVWESVSLFTLRVKLLS